MTVYLLYEAYGEYEDYREKVVGCFATKEKAKEVKEKLVAVNLSKKKQYDVCNSCPFYLDIAETEEEKPPCFKEDLDGYCENTIVIYEETGYWITEEEVIE